MTDAAVKIHRSGREVCNLWCAAGKREYNLRRLEMWIRQGGRCCLCLQMMAPTEVTFDHERGRGMGGSKREDRTVLPDGSWINGAAHLLCNTQKGSRFVDYNHNHKSEVLDGRVEADCN